MNDPNGLVYFDGEYHLFFQHDPNSITQTPVMSWGHAVSPDLAHWTEIQIALSPDDHGYVWSGSAVVDWNNSAGFQTGSQPALVAMYTAAKKPFAQCIAYSNDRGRTWTHYDKNPVIAHIAFGNRDPHMIWYEPGKKWVVVFFKDVNNEFVLEESADLKTWKPIQEFRVPDCNECPDFFPMALDGDASKLKWVFTAANGRYVVGSFDGSKFTLEQDPRQVDFGQNYYAVQTYADIPAADGRRIQIAWMSGGRYPHMPFNQQMSFPAQLTLHTTPDGAGYTDTRSRKSQRFIARNIGFPTSNLPTTTNPCPAWKGNCSTLTQKSTQATRRSSGSASTANPSNIPLKSACFPRWEMRPSSWITGACTAHPRRSNIHRNIRKRRPCLVHQLLSSGCQRKRPASVCTGRKRESNVTDSS